MSVGVPTPIGRKRSGVIGDTVGDGRCYGREPSGVIGDCQY